MNRFVSLLLVALSLAAVGLAQPAQAQWVKGLPFYDHSNSHSAQPATIITSETPVGYINITAAPTSDYNYGEYGTGGTYTGSVCVNYVWIGGSLTKAMVLSTSQSSEATGAGNGTSGGSSLAGGAYGYFSSSSSGWDNRASSAPATYYFDVGVTPPTKTQSASIGGNVSAYYNGTTQSTSVTAQVTFADPVVSQ